MAGFGYSLGVVNDASGTIYVADTGGLKIRKITSAGVVTSLAGISGFPGSTDGAGSSARFLVLLVSLLTLAATYM